MFCRNCGKELRDGAEFCGNCGMKIAIDPSGEDSVHNLIMNVDSPEKTTTSGTIQSSQTNTEKVDKKHIAIAIAVLVAPRLLVLIAIICFFFPFMSVSCGGYSTDISGIDMIFGDSSVSEQVEYYSDGENDGSLFNWFILLAALLALDGLVNLNSKSAAESSGYSALFLIIFRITAKWYYKIGDTRLSEVDDSMIHVEFGGALYWAIILLCIAALIHFLYSMAEENKDDS